MQQRVGERETGEQIYIRDRKRGVVTCVSELHFFHQVAVGCYCCCWGAGGRDLILVTFRFRSNETGKSSLGLERGVTED